MTVDPPTIDQFRPGTLHPVSRVAAVLGISADTVLNRIRRGVLAAVRPVGSTHYYLTGEEVQRYWRSMGLALTPPPRPPTARQKKKERDAALKAIGC
jgi:excisionase family DNA binding protein